MLHLAILPTNYLSRFRGLQIITCQLIKIKKVRRLPFIQVGFGVPRDYSYTITKSEPDFTFFLCFPLLWLSRTYKTWSLQDCIIVSNLCQLFFRVFVKVFQNPIKARPYQQALPILTNLAFSASIIPSQYGQRFHPGMARRITGS
jgi:hypothetical protein